MSLTLSPETEMNDLALEGLSARERNALKRKRKALGKPSGNSNSSGACTLGSSSQHASADAAPVPTKLRIVSQKALGAGPSCNPVPVFPNDYRIDSQGEGSSIPQQLHQPLQPFEVSQENVVVVQSKAKSKARMSMHATCASSSPKDGNFPANPKPIGNQLRFTDGEWPFTSLVEILMIDMFSSQWEYRHGAVMSLIPILKSQGFGAGRHIGANRLSNIAKHQIWMEDIGLRLICLLCLDRFGDYVGDQVVAPVRETGAQAISLVGRWMSKEGLEQMINILDAMVQQIKSVKTRQGYVWQVRHAGLMGMKYLVAVRTELMKSRLGKTEPEDTELSNSLNLPTEVHEAKPVSLSEEEFENPASLLSIIISSVLIGLRDQDDDVRAAASATLLPATDLLIKHLPETLGELLEVLWDALGSSMDDLSSSVGNIMDLLANLITSPKVLKQLSNSVGDQALPVLIPRLFPFFRHTISNVRLSVAKASAVFLQMSDLPAHSWVDSRLLRLVFQNLLVEERADIRSVSSRLWDLALEGLLGSAQEPAVLLSAIQSHIGEWFQLVSTPKTQKLNASLFFNADSKSKHMTAQESSLLYNVDKSIMSQDLSLVSMDDIVRGRLAASRALGYLMSKLTPYNQLQLFTPHLMNLLDSEFAFPRIIAATLVEEWALAYRRSDLSNIALLTENLGQLPAMEPISYKLRSSSLFLGTSSTYSELDSLLNGSRKDTEGLLTTFASLGKVPLEKIPTLPSDGFSIETALHVANYDYQNLIVFVARSNKKTALASLEDRRRKLLNLVEMFQSDKQNFDVQIDAAVAAAVVAIREIPGKISPLIKGLTQSIKTEMLIDLQTRSACALAAFVDVCTSLNSPVKNDPTDKIIGNLSTYLCQDESQTPTFVKSKSFKEGIFSAQDTGVRPLTKSGYPTGLSSEKVNSEEISQAKLLRRGAELTLSSLAAKFGDDMIERIPKLWSCMSEPLLTLFNSGDVKTADDRMGDEVTEPKLAQGLLDCLTVLPAVARSLPASAHPRLISLFVPLCHAVKSRFAVVRYSVVRCYAELCRFSTEQGLMQFITHVLPLVGDPLQIVHRQGAVEMLSRLVNVLGMDILAYIIFLIVPVLGRMSDPDDDVRYLSTHTFACLIKLMPLEAGVPNPPGFTQKMLEKRQLERSFLSQLLGGSKIEEYKIPVDIRADLRKYQREGISWLAFLAKYQLHGILCDDMGLGKTLQSICILASKHHERAEQHRITKSPDTVHLPSLVVCPPTLTGHWAHEIRTYTYKLKPLLYIGGPNERASLVRRIRKYDVVILSYDIVRNDIEHLSRIPWNYCILDEGHIIKNAKSKLSKAVKLLKANHRLILSGTPIQNNALELWSLFDFLMPGFLGTEKYFNERFGKPISASRDAKSSSKEQEAGALALEALHKQVLPFLLRRLKEDVLDDLPPKIIQDYYCELSPIQKQLYEDFSKSQAKNEVEGFVKETQPVGGGGSTQHVFQALQYLKKLVNHPALVLRPDVAKHQEILSKLGPKGLKDISHSPKLLALRQILRDCGIGQTTSTHLTDSSLEDGGGAATSGGTIPQHRVLIFCQMKQMLDIIEHNLFRAQMPTVTYMRIDGSTDVTKRHDIVQTFNADPSIDCLLLTTHVGGLGLNLTGADTVIFVEHDWNPMKDLQAMDRKKLWGTPLISTQVLQINVDINYYFFSLQRFKLNIATSIVNQQNSSLGSLDTEQILDLFNVSSVDSTSAAKEGSGAGSNGSGLQGTGMKKNVLDGLEDLPPESEYESLDAAKFLSSL
ncbi:hypothetical protein BY996DRAFT_6434687 [Phakopsora pachyrhizi]|nr:hypothetical protein BY996DRAFT_6434687 [Phakopsora pachyrhizi]